MKEIKYFKKRYLPELNFAHRTEKQPYKTKIETKTKHKKNELEIKLIT